MAELNLRGGDSYFHEKKATFINHLFSGGCGLFATSGDMLPVTYTHTLDDITGDSF